MTLTELLVSLAVFGLGASLAASSSGGLVSAMCGGEAAAVSVAEHQRLQAALDHLAGLISADAIEIGEGGQEIRTETVTARFEGGPGGRSDLAVTSEGEPRLRIALPTGAEAYQWGYDAEARVLSLLARTEGSERILATASLRVNAPLNCRYDVVGHICRRPEG